MTEPPAADIARLHPSLAHNLVATLGWSTLRPLQREAIEPLLRGDDALLLAPTAGGKTEAATFPILTRMAAEGWTGLSVLYLCPLKALLNNLLPRLEVYGAWAGRRVALWHGDTPASRRKAILTGPPDLLLTTPESLESMLVSPNVDHTLLFRDLRAVIVDEVHAFGSGDRGWHLLAVLERLSRVAGRPLQRIGLSATVGNPEGLLHWLQGSSAGKRNGVVVGQAPRSFGKEDAEPELDLQLDYVGSLANAAKVIAALHRGEKRLVFADSKRLVEMLGAELRARGITTHLVHASLSLDERRRAEQAFAEGRDCVIVSTSALELGIDVGDLDRVIQVNSPLTVAAFLQRLGRSGRRPGTVRNMLFLALDEDQFLLAAGLLLAWGRGFVEPVAAPPEPRHIVAQQLLALLCVPKTYATRRYSWITPPTRSRRRTRMWSRSVTSSGSGRSGAAWFKGAVWPVRVAETLVLAQDAHQVVLVPGQGPVQQLTTATAYPAFHDRVHSGRLNSGADHPGARGLEDGVERRGEAGVPVMQDELHARLCIFQVHQEVPGLLHYPRLDRMPGGSKDPDAAGAVLDGGQDVDRRAVEQAGGEEVQRQDRLGLGPQEFGPARAVPARCRADASVLEDLPDRGRRHRDAKPGELAMDPAVSP